MDCKATWIIFKKKQLKCFNSVITNIITSLILSFVEREMPVAAIGVRFRALSWFQDLVDDVQHTVSCERILNNGCGIVCVIALVRIQTQ